MSSTPDFFEQNTPTAADRRFYFTAVDATALQTRLAAASIGTWVVYLSKNGGTPAVPSGGASVTEVGSSNMLGLWYLQLAAADVDTVGKLAIKITNTSATDIEPREAVMEVRQAFIATVSSGTTTAITCDLAQTTADYWKDCLVRVRTGTLAGQVKKVGGYSTGLLSLATGYAFTGAFANGDVIEILTK